MVNGIKLECVEERKSIGKTIAKLKDNWDFMRFMTDL